MEEIDKINKVVVGQEFRLPRSNNVIPEGYDSMRVKVTRTKNTWWEYLATFLVIFLFIGIGVVIGYLLR